MFTAIDHPAIASRDTARLIEWYCRVLGMKVIAANGQTPPTALVGYGSETAIEIMPVKEDGPEPAGWARFAPGLRHLALRVTSFEAARAHLASHATDLITQPGPAIGGGTIASFRDPDGNELQIVQRTQ